MQVIRNKELLKGMAQSYITLLPKSDPDKTAAVNFRPISLLNTDYEISSKILSEILRPLMDHLMHKDQQCAVKRRKFHVHLHNIIRDIIVHCREKSHTRIHSKLKPREGVRPRKP